MRKFQGSIAATPLDKAQVELHQLHHPSLNVISPSLQLLVLKTLTRLVARLEPRTNIVPVAIALYI
ncbi:MAG TPA: hypothetical protein V6C71_17750 [Coleofasciculaceae cyanobacterium]